MWRITPSAHPPYRRNDGQPVVGWVERSDTHHFPAIIDGYRVAQPILRVPDEMMTNQQYNDRERRGKPVKSTS
jgi:hypothetical protein